MINVSDLYRYDFSAAYISVLALFTVILQKSFNMIDMVLKQHFITQLIVNVEQDCCVIFFVNTLTNVFQDS